MKKTCHESCRLMPEEKEYIRAQSKACGISESEYLRRLVREKKSGLSHEAYQQRKELLRQINYIGHNINQIVRNANTYLYSEQDKQRLYMLMKQLEERVIAMGAENN